MSSNRIKKLNSKELRKILYFTDESLEKQPIVSSQVIPLLESLDSKNYSFDLLVADETNFIKNFKQKEKIHVCFIKQNHIIIRFLSYLFFILRNRTRYDIIHARSYIPMICLSILKPFLKSPVIFDMRGVLPEEMKEQSRNVSGVIFSKILKFLEPFLLRKSNSIIVVSKKFQDHILQSYDFLNSQTIEVIPTFAKKYTLTCPANLREEFKIPFNAPIFVYSGSMTKWQNFDIVVKIFKEIKKILSDAHLMIFSKDVHNGQQFLKNSLNRNEYSISFIPNEHLIGYLEQCDMGFLLREQNIINKVSAPIKFNEYITAKLPIIISSGIGDSEDLLQEFKIGVVIDDFSCQEKIEKFVNSNISEIKNRIANKNNADFEAIYNKKIGFENSVKSYNKIYQKI